MIECTNQYIWYKNKHRKTKFKRCLRSFVALFLIASLLLYYRNMTCNNIFEICFQKAKTFCTQSVNVAIMETLTDDLTYNDLITIEKNSIGDVVLMSANSIKINNINTQISNKTLNLMQEKLNDGIPIPFMAFLGVKLLSGLGSNVYLKTVNATNVKCEFKSEFKSAGINQTLHSIYVDVIVEISANMPLNSKTAINNTTILISEAILVGKVPDIYLKESLFN